MDNHEGRYRIETMNREGHWSPMIASDDHEFITRVYDRQVEGQLSHAMLMRDTVAGQVVRLATAGSGQQRREPEHYAAYLAGLTADPRD